MEQRLKPEDQRSTMRMITLLARKSQAYFGRALCQFDLTAAEQPFFMALQHCEGATQEELTAQVCVNKAVTTRVVQSMEKKGLLTRVQDQQDRRQNRIYPTERAKQLGPVVRRELLRFNARMTQGISQEQLEQVHEVLLKMEENFADIMRDGLPEEKEGAE